MLQTSGIKLLEIIKNSYLKASEMHDEGDTLQAMHQNRSRFWVDCLANRFKSEFSDDDIGVFSKYNSSNRETFGLNELLYDVVVCRLGYTRAAVQKRELPYIQQVIWQIESEFALDTREILIDFSKLVLGSAPYKLFIGSASKNNDKILDVLIPVANNCSGQVFISFIPHPKNWKGPDTYGLSVYEFRKATSDELKATWVQRS
ncbi:hypothetical protein ACFLUZ_01760 [Chloroflexota bacterium]